MRSSSRRRMMMTNNNNNNYAPFFSFFFKNPPKPLNLILSLLLSLFCLFSLLSLVQFPSPTSSLTLNASNALGYSSNKGRPFSDLLQAYKEWDSLVGCGEFREKNKKEFDLGFGNRSSDSDSMQNPDGFGSCESLGVGGSRHVSVLVRRWTWIPDELENLHSCRCGISCLWTKSPVLADKPDALLFETMTPPERRVKGQPLRIYMDLEAGRRSTGKEDLFISYHAKDDVQSTYAGNLFHANRNVYVALHKRNDTLIYWSSSRCLVKRNTLAKKLLSLVPHHSFGKCLNNVGGRDVATQLYPECDSHDDTIPKWWYHLHCAMSHYKFVLAIENTMTESYITEKLFYALDAGAVPIYFGAPNVMDFVPPHSIIDGSKFSTMEELAAHVKAVANDPVAYAEYHAWRRCGVMGNYHRARALSLNSLPCRVCEAVMRKGGRNAETPVNQGAQDIESTVIEAGKV